MSTSIPLSLLSFHRPIILREDKGGGGSDLQTCEVFCGIALLVEWRRGVEGEEEVWREAFHVPGKQHNQADLSEKEAKLG